MAKVREVITKNVSGSYITSWKKVENLQDGDCYMIALDNLSNKSEQWLFHADPSEHSIRLGQDSLSPGCVYRVTVTALKSHSFNNTIGLQQLAEGTNDFKTGQLKGQSTNATQQPNSKETDQHNNLLVKDISHQPDQKPNTSTTEKVRPKQGTKLTTPEENPQFDLPTKIQRKVETSDKNVTKPKSTVLPTATNLQQQSSIVTQKEVNFKRPIISESTEEKVNIPPKSQVSESIIINPYSGVQPVASFQHKILAGEQTILMPSLTSHMNEHGQERSIQRAINDIVQQIRVPSDTCNALSEPQSMATSQRNNSSQFEVGTEVTMKYHGLQFVLGGSHSRQGTNLGPAYEMAQQGQMIPSKSEIFEFSSTTAMYPHQDGAEQAATNSQFGHGYVGAQQTPSHNQTLECAQQFKAMLKEKVFSSDAHTPPVSDRIAILYDRQFNGKAVTSTQYMYEEYQYVQRSQHIFHQANIPQSEGNDQFEQQVQHIKDVLSRVNVDKLKYFVLLVVVWGLTAAATGYPPLYLILGISFWSFVMFFIMLV